MENVDFSGDMIDLISNKTRDIGKELAQKSLISKTQLRSFFMHTKSLQKKIKTEEDFRKFLPAIKMITPKLEYAMGKGGKDREQRVSQEFAGLLSNSINQISKKEDFDKFMLFFESLVGYYFGEEGRKEEKKRQNQNQRQQNWRKEK